MTNSAFPYYLGFGDDHYVCSFSCNASAFGKKPTDSMSKGYTLTLSFKYIGSQMDSPPTSVIVNLNDRVVGTWEYGVPPAPTGLAANGQYSVSTSLSGDTLSGNSGTITQGTTLKEGVQNPPGLIESRKIGVTVQTPLSGWNLTPGSGTQIIYTFIYKTIVVNGSTSASATGAPSGGSEGGIGTQEIASFYGLGSWNHTLWEFAVNGSQADQGGGNGTNPGTGGGGSGGGGTSARLYRMRPSMIDTQGLRMLIALLPLIGQ